MKTSNLLHFWSEKLFVRSHNFNEWQSKNFTLQKVRLQNKQLAKTLEKTCKEKGGVLTFGEFIREEMFGGNGYYEKHKNFGKTNVETIWPEAIAAICKNRHINSVVELGSGDGALGIKTLQIAKQEKIPLQWTAIEINKKLYKLLLKKKIANFLVFNSLSEIPVDKHLFVFPYSLDSMPSEVIINTSWQKSPATGLIGVKIKEDVLEETILSKTILGKKNMEFQKGVLKIAGYSFDFSLLKLESFQRAFVPLYSFLAIIEAVQRMKISSEILIIDEVKSPPNYNLSYHHSYHLGFPRILNFKRDYDDLVESYKNTGENLWYFPFYLKPLLGLLEQLGFTKVKFDIEERMAANLKGIKWKKAGLYFCYGIKGRYTNSNKRRKFVIPSPI